MNLKYGCYQKLKSGMWKNITNKCNNKIFNCVIILKIK